MAEVTASKKAEVAWLIEASHEGRPVYWFVDKELMREGFTSNNLKACRFARKIDADMVRERFAPGEEIRSVEHMWL